MTGDDLDRLFPLGAADAPDPTSNVPLSARVSPDLYAAVLTAAERTDVDRSTAIRRLLRRGLEAERLDAIRDRPAAKPAQTTDAKPPPYNGTRYRVLTAVVHGGARGMTADDVARVLYGVTPGSAGGRMSELERAGYVIAATLGASTPDRRPYVNAGTYGTRPLQYDEGDGDRSVTDAELNRPIRRRTRAGHTAIVHVPTAAGVAALGVAKRVAAEAVALEEGDSATPTSSSSATTDVVAPAPAPSSSAPAIARTHVAVLGAAGRRLTIGDPPADAPECDRCGINRASLELERGPYCRGCLNELADEADG